MANDNLIASAVDTDERRRCTVVAEIGQAHDGSLGTAHAYIDAVAETGADAVKFQTHIAAAESTPAEPWRVKFSRQDASRYDYWNRMEFSEPQWQGLSDHAHEVGLRFMSSPFSVEAVDLLRRVGVDAWKIASGEVSNTELLDAVMGDGRPVVISSGMSSLDELDKAVEAALARGVDVTLLQCTTAYPCPAERIGLNLIQHLRERYGVPVGLSDHSGTIYGGLAAATLGAAMLEVHVTFSHQCFGPDVPASITLGQLAELVEGVRFIEAALGSHVDKDEVFADMTDVRALFTRSIVARRKMTAGEIVERADVAFKKPGSGIPPDRADEILGRRLRVAVDVDHLLRFEDLELSE